MGHRIRGMWGNEEDKFAGPVEADETYIGGLEKNKHADKKLRAGRGTVGKTPIAGVKDRATNQVRTEVVESTNKATLQGFVLDHTQEETIIHTDEHAAYKGLPRHHEAVAHGAGQVCPRDGPHQRAGIPLGTVQAWDRRHVPPYLGQALGPVQQRIRGTT